MQFQVPQFIEVEDKIIGPLTFRQFVYLVGGAGASYLFLRVLPLLIAGPLVLCVGALTLALAFFEYNGRSFTVALENGFFYLTRSKFYLWDNQHKAKKPATQKVVAQESAQAYLPKLSDSRLRDLAWSLDIKERVAAGIARDEERGTDTVVSPRVPEA